MSAAPRPTCFARYPLGVRPVCLLNRDENVPRLLNPTRPQISVTDRSAVLSISSARSIRRRVRYCPGVSPYASLKHRTKW